MPYPASVLPLPPFRGAYAVEVKAGLLVLFPSWLLHEVEATEGEALPEGAYRISWAFNMAGDWHETNAATVELNRTRAAAAPPAPPPDEDEDDGGAFGYGAKRGRRRDEL